MIADTVLLSPVASELADLRSRRSRTYAWLTTFTVITTDADPGLDRIHDRQPLILEREDWGRWLDPTLTDEDTVRELLAFHQPGRLDAYPISTAVNATRNNGPDLLRPVGREQLVGVVDPVTGEVIGG